MEGRMKKYMQVSPERAKVWTEKSSKYQYTQNYPQQQLSSNQKVAVIYYLCRNRQLEHPHFMEVTLSSTDGLYLRDVIERLNVLRGRGMASMYSWSCKRSYRNGFVWHDLSDDDLILPAHGNEYVLKGSEIFEESNSGRFSPAASILNQKALPEPPSYRSREESSSSSSLNGRATKSSQDGEQSPPVQRPLSSPDSITGKNSAWNGSLSLTEYKVYPNDGVADASTQTEETSRRTVKTETTCVKGLSTDDCLSEPEIREAPQSPAPVTKDTPERTVSLVLPPSSTSSATSSSGRTDTLESLIRADARKFSSFRILEEEEFRTSTSTKHKASNVILQLISCGSVSVKDHNFGLIPNYKPGFSNSKFPSPLFSTSSFMFGELDCLSENPRFMGLKSEDREYFSGSLVETSMVKEGLPTLERSSSYNADRCTQQLDSAEEKEEANSTKSKCIPRSIKASLSWHPRSESMRSPHSEGPRISSDRTESSRTTTAPGTPIGSSKRRTEPVSGRKLSTNLDSSRNDKENIIKIEERLASGARVIIESKSSPDGEGTS